ncbi:hypothetical protein T5B8_13720 [Salinisphaera sp. T5B8]|uniref:hypothetical protein n=1 Tax=Salinisphaera sp. T5B8 TaxID=1304154 RepID=UPI00333FAF1B
MTKAIAAITTATMAMMGGLLAPPLPEPAAVGRLGVAEPAAAAFGVDVLAELLVVPVVPALAALDDAVPDLGVPVWVGVFDDEPDVVPDLAVPEAFAPDALCFVLALPALSCPERDLSAA